jgi:hypothetical protein
MATATKTRPTKSTNTIDGLRAAATAKWRTWATALASGGALPPTGELLEAAGLLGRTVDDLERDAAIIRDHNYQQTQVEFWAAEVKKVEDARGPIEDVRKMIEELESQIEALREAELAGYSEGYQLGTAKSKVERLCKQRPDLFEGDA